MVGTQAAEQRLSAYPSSDSRQPGWLSAFWATRYRFVLRARDQILLPPYKGSALRGGFGRALRGVACLGSRCPCRLGRPCAYTYVFESPVPEGKILPSFNREVPQPFVIEPPLDPRPAYTPGDSLEFCLVLIGHGIEYLPYVIVAFEELGRMGLGKGRGRYALEAVWSDHGQDSTLVFDGTSRRFVGQVEPVSMADLAPPCDGEIERVSVRFLTPTRLREDGHLAVRLDFPVLIRALLRRTTALAYFHCGIEADGIGQQLLPRAEEVLVEGQRLRWWDWERYSGRQACRMKLGGIVGHVTYNGPLAPFLPLLRLGELVHVGKATSFGNGQYVLWQ